MNKLGSSIFNKLQPKEMTFADIFASLKDELAARYRSPVWGATLLALVLYHWKIVVFFFSENHSANDAIAFVEANVTTSGILVAFACALIYVIAFPWFEYLVATLASFGKRHRNRFHAEEREYEIGQRKLIAQKQAKLIELELKNKTDQSMISDIELVKNYQNILSGENFGRWLNDLQNGAVNSQLSHAISNYLQKADALEGKFINSEVEAAHATFVSDLSTVGSALNDVRKTNESALMPELKEFSRKAADSQLAYRQKAREVLGV